MIKNRVNVKTFEFFIISMMALFGVGAMALLYYALRYPFVTDLFLVLVIEMLIIVVISVLGLSYLVIRIWEKHIVPYYVSDNIEKKQVEKEDKKNSQK